MIDNFFEGKKKGNRGWTPLHLAAYFGHVAVVRSLLKVMRVISLLILIILQLFVVVFCI